MITKEVQVNGEVSRLLALRGDAAKKALNTTTSEIAIAYLSALFKGNGWAVAFAEPQKRNTLLLADTKNPAVILLMVKLILNKEELAYEEAREELIEFENNLSPLYGCSQFAIIAVNGVTAKAEKLEQYNLLMQDWSYVDELIEHYNPDKIQQPRIQLFAHNKQTYKKVCRLMDSTQTVAVVQATGTGKSFLIAKLMQDFTGERRLVMAPSLYIIEQVKEHIRWDAGRIEFMTYARSMNLSRSEIAALQPRIIVLDEYHRCGAEEWGRGVENILNAYPEAFKFGTSATPIRYMDNARDMSQEIFAGNVAENLSLAQAIVRKILPMPKYVCALYTLAEEAGNLKDRIKNSRKSEELKTQLLLELDSFSLDWEQSRGIPHVLKKHLTKGMKKFIVFCRNEEHLVEMEPVVKKWFKEATGDFPLKTYRVHASESKSDEHLQEFKFDTSTSYTQLLFSINMLNEGVHVKDVHGVILLRPTESPNIFYQQIGRCLKVGLNHEPVIFDFVNNFKSIRTQDFIYDLEDARRNYLMQRADENLSDRCPSFTVKDEVREITEVFGEIKFKLDTWEESFEKLNAFKAQNGHCIVPHTYKGDNFLYSWVSRQRQKCYYGKLADDRYQRLNELGVEWNFEQFELAKIDRWEEKYELLSAFRLKYGHCIVNRTHQEFDALNVFVHRNRHCYKLGILMQSRIDKLNAIGFEWDRKLFFEGRWQQRFDELAVFINKHGHCKVSPKKNQTLVSWMNLQRKLFKENKLDRDRKLKLDSIGFEWDPNPEPEVLFERRFEEVRKFWLEQGHCKLPSKGPLGLCMGYFKGRYKRGMLTTEQQHKLDGIGLDYKTGEDSLDKRERHLKQLAAFKKEYGHVNVAARHKQYAALKVWLTAQRMSYRKGKLPSGFVEQLEKLGVVWDQFDAFWKEKYEQLKKHVALTGSFESYTSLSSWMVKQRQDFRKGVLSAEKTAWLNAISFEWDPLEKIWEEQFSALVQFKNLHGHCRVPQKKEYKILANWCGHVRTAYRRGKLTPERIQRFEALGFVWNLIEQDWHDQYAMVKEFVEKHGWNKLTRKHKKLRNWVNTQRFNKRKGIETEDKIMLLNRIGISWAPTDEAWDISYQKMADYADKFGTTYITGTKNDYIPLRSWSTDQRKRYKDHELTAEQIEKLNKIGFIWDGKLRETWDRFYEMACAFYSNHGHLTVPGKENKKLSEWLNKQRGRKNTGTIPEDQIRRLDKIGYNWLSNDEVLEDVWMQKLKDLKRFKEKFGHTNISQKGQHSALGVWMQNQKQNRKKGILTDKRIALLDETGFNWVPNNELLEQTWMKKYNSLKRFKQRWGHCNVPSKWKPDLPLAAWVALQRQNRKHNILAENRILLLDKIGFEWKRKG